MLHRLIRRCPIRFNRQKRLIVIDRIHRIKINIACFPAIFVIIFEIICPIMKILLYKNRLGNVVYFLITCFVVMLSAFSIFHQLGLRALWYDEVRTVLYYAPHPFKITNGDPPVFPFILSIITRFTHSEFWLRFPSAFAFIASTAVIAVGYRKLVGRKAAIIAAVTLATSYFALSKFQLARPYAFFTFFTIVSFYSFWNVLQFRNWKWAPVYVLATFFALHAQYCAFIVFGIQVIFGVVYALTQLRKDKTLFIRLFLSIAIIILCCMPWYLDLYNNFAAFKRANQATPASGFSFSVYITLLNAQFFRETSVFIPAIFLLLGVFLSFLKKHRSGALLILTWLIVSAGTLFFMLRNGKICFASRYFLFFQPAVYLLASFAIVRTAELLSQLSFKKYSQIIFYALVFILHVTLCYSHYKDFINYLKYFRHDDTKNLKSLVEKLKVPFYSIGFYHPGFRYYKLPMIRSNPLRHLHNHKFVIYTVDSQMNVEGNPQFKNCDIIYLPFKGVGENYAIFKSKSPLSNYWNNAIDILDEALALTPHHKQMEEELISVWLFSGRKDVDSLKNAKVVAKRVEKFADRKSKLKAGNVWTVKDITPLFGWGKIEKSGKISFRWSTRKRSGLLLPVYSKKLKKLIFEGSSYSSPKTGSQKIKAWLGNCFLGEIKLEPGKSAFSFEIPKSVLQGERRLLLEFSNPVSPEALRQGGDRRVLALNLRAIRPFFSKPVPGNSINIAAPGSEAWLGSNWSHPESWDIKPFRWLEGSTGKIFWTVSSGQPEGNWKIDFKPFSTPGKAQRVSVFQDEIVLTNFVLAEGWKTYNISSPPLNSGETLLKFVFDYAVSPKELNLGGDRRSLSAAVSDISRNIWNY